jgi:hypothetical protein
MMGVGYDELRQREKQRQRQRQLRLSASVIAVLLLVSTAYMAVADAGLNVPAGKGIRTFLDRHDKSLMRRAHSNAEIRSAAASHRRELNNRTRAWANFARMDCCHAETRNRGAKR